MKFTILETEDDVRDANLLSIQICKLLDVHMGPRNVKLGALAMSAAMGMTKDALDPTLRELVMDAFVRAMNVTIVAVDDGTIKLAPHPLRN